MSLSVKLSRNQRKAKVPINKENRNFYILHLKVDGVTIENVNGVLSSLEDSRVLIHFKNYGATATHSERLYDGVPFSRSKFVEAPFIPIEFHVPSINIYDYVEFELQDLTSNSKHPDYTVNVVIQTRNLSVSISTPELDFRTHFEKQSNIKMFLSAPFGQGKTTFLEIFFARPENECNLFKLFPVNYSVASNEDIFKYIKANILLELLEKPCNFNKENFTYAETAPAFFKTDPVGILGPFVKLLPKIGHSAYEIVRPIVELANKYFEYHDKIQIDDEKHVISFIKKLCEAEGSIFEDNFFTQLIRQQLEYLRTTTGKRNVLIIDDLDRIDPEHVFRILNVLSANFDQREASTCSNKFGFDKIILVGDYLNIKNIYSYKYGPSVLFDGYISKYFSEKPFHYDNTKAMLAILDDVRKRYFNGSHPTWKVVETVLQHLVLVNQITLRSLLKLLHLEVLGYCNGNLSHAIESKRNFTLYTYYNAIHLLQQIVDLDTLTTLIEVYKETESSPKRIEYDELTRLGLVSLADVHNFSSGEAEFMEKDSRLRFKFDRNHNNNHDYNYYCVVGDIAQITNNGINVKKSFTRVEFFEIFRLNVIKYIQIGGLA